MAEVGGSYVSDETALERVSREHVARWPGLAAPITETTVRTWVREDAEFAEALKAALRHREEGRRLGQDKPQALTSPEQWPYAGRLDERPDPCRVAYDVRDLLGGRR